MLNERTTSTSAVEEVAKEKKFPMLKILKKLLTYIIYAAVAYFIFKGLRGNIESIPSLSDIRWHWLILSLIVFSFHSIYNALIWYYIMTSSGEKVELLPQMEVYLKSYALRYIPGNVVGVLSRATLNRPYGVSMLKSLWGWFLENSIYLFLGCVIGLPVIFRYSTDLYLQIFLIIVAIIGGILIIFKLDLVEKIFLKLVSLKFADKVKDRRDVLGLSLKQRLIIMVMYIFAWVIYSASFILTVMSVVDVDLKDIVVLSSTNAIAWSLGYLAVITPSGGGIRELVMNNALVRVLSYNAGIAIAIVAIARTIFIVAELLGYALFVIFKYLYNLWKKKTLLQKEI